MIERNSSVVPQSWEKRHTQVFLVALCSAINYADRVNISIAVVDMKHAYRWEMETQAFVLSSFFWGCESPPCTG